MLYRFKVMTVDCIVNIALYALLATVKSVNKWYIHRDIS